MRTSMKMRKRDFRCAISMHSNMMRRVGSASLTPIMLWSRAVMRRNGRRRMGFDRRRAL
jgi:hypothetical protein